MNLTAPEWIAVVLGLIAASMVVASQHGIGTRNTQPANRPNGDHQ